MLCAPSVVVVNFDFVLVISVIGLAVVDTVVVVFAVVGCDVAAVVISLSETDVDAVVDGDAVVNDVGIIIGGGRISQFRPRNPDGLQGSEKTKINFGRY